MTKLTGIYAEVAFNLTIPLLFALTVGNAFAITHTAWSLWRRSLVWQRGIMAALLGPFLVALLGNLDGYGQILRQLSERSPIHLQSALPGLSWLVQGIAGLVEVALGRTTLPAYDFWAPSRVLPATINEFPYWSFLFADLHPHLIGIPLSILFVGALFSLLLQYGEIWSGANWRGVALVVALAFLLGALSSVNLWELPTYLGLAILTVLLSEYRCFGHIRFVRVAITTAMLLFGALFFYLPFYSNFVNVGASGIGWVTNGDDVGLWLLLWGGLGFIVVSWLLWTARHAGLSLRMRPRRTVALETDFRHEILEPSLEDSAPMEIDLTEWIALDEGYREAQRADIVGLESNWESDSEDGPLEITTPNRTAREIAPTEKVPSDDRKSPSPVPDFTQVGDVKDVRSGVARLLGMSIRRFDRLPRLWYLHQLLVQKPSLSYILGVVAIPALLVVAIATGVFGRIVLALCLVVLAMALPLLWRREREAEAADHLATMLAVTGVAILAGTQVIYLKDFLQGSDYYRMNTLFKFFNQVWVLWALAASIALPRLWSAAWSVWPGGANGQGATPLVHLDQGADGSSEPWSPSPTLKGASFAWRGWGIVWRLACVLILAVCSVYIVFGTPSRLSQRFVGWVPPFGTLDGLAFMQQGQYSWPDDSNTIDLKYDSEAIHWLLKFVRGNLVIAESAEVDYYRAGGTRVASLTGLSGLRGPHVSEQRYGEQVGARDGLHREFWATPNEERTIELINELQISLIYAGQLELFHHPEGVQKLANMASEGRLDVLYENEGVLIYVVPGRLALQDGGWYEPVPVAEPFVLLLPSMSAQPFARLEDPEPS